MDRYSSNETVSTVTFDSIADVVGKQAGQQQIANSVVVALCAALASTAFSAYSRKSTGIRTVAADLFNGIVAGLFALAIPVFLGVLAYAGVPYADVSSSCQFTSALIGVCAYFVLYVVPRAFFTIDHRAISEYHTRLQKDLRQDKTGEAVATEEVVEEDDGETEEFSTFEPGAGFIQYHYLNPQIVFATVVSAVAVTLTAEQVAARFHVFVYAAIALFFATPVLLAVWRNTPFEKRYPIMYAFQWAFGMVFTANFAIFWGIPLFGQGQAFKLLLHIPLRIPFRWIDEWQPLRNFAAKYVYSNPRHSDYAATCLLAALSFAGSLTYVLYYQLAHGSLPWWLVIAYYAMWVGPGGRTMGAAYSVAHKEGHFKTMYKPWVRKNIGNFFENIMGNFFGNVPYNFTTSHVAIHHRLDAGWGDTFFQWDLDRTSANDLMIYLYRICLHMSGWSSLNFFQRKKEYVRYNKLMKGAITYWFAVPMTLLIITGSPSFVFWIYFQPFVAMTYFLGFINYFLHGFVEFDENKKHIKTINSSCIVDGQDDYWGEDDHYSHHYDTNVYFKDLPDHRAPQREVFAKHHAPIYTKFSMVEAAAFMLIGKWDLMFEHYIDLNEEGKKLNQEEFIELNIARAKTIEASHKDYSAWFDAGCPEPVPKRFNRKCIC